jgi:hypothetical protein
MVTIREVIDHLICAPLRYYGKNRQADSETLHRIIHKMEVALINFPVVVTHNIYRVKQRSYMGYIDSSLFKMVVVLKIGHQNESSLLVLNYLFCAPIYLVKLGLFSKKRGSPLVFY